MEAEGLKNNAGVVEKYGGRKNRWEWWLEL